MDDGRRVVEGSSHLQTIEIVATPGYGFKSKKPETILKGEVGDVVLSGPGGFKFKTTGRRGSRQTQSKFAEPTSV